MSPSIYNATDGPIPVDRAGRMLPGRERDDVDTLEGLSRHIEAGRIVVLDELEQPAQDDAGDSTDDAPKRTRKGRTSTSPQEA